MLCLLRVPARLPPAAMLAVGPFGPLPNCLPVPVASTTYIGIDGDSAHAADVLKQPLQKL